MFFVLLLPCYLLLLLWAYDWLNTDLHYVVFISLLLLNFLGAFLLSRRNAFGYNILGLLLFSALGITQLFYSFFQPLFDGKWWWKMILGCLFLLLGGGAFLCRQVEIQRQFVENHQRKNT